LDRHEVLGGRDKKHIRLAAVAVHGRALVRLASNGGQAQAPAEAEYAVARARVVGQAQLRAEVSFTATLVETA